MNYLEKIMRCSIGDYAEFKRKCEDLGYTERDMDRILELSKCAMLSDILNAVENLDDTLKSIDF